MTSPDPTIAAGRAALAELRARVTEMEKREKELVEALQKCAEAKMPGEARRIAHEALASLNSQDKSNG